MGIGLVGSIGTMMGAIYTSPENAVQKHLFWLVRPRVILPHLKSGLMHANRPLTVAKQQH